MIYQYYTVYDTTTGNITRTLTSNEASIDANTPTGCDWIVGEYYAKEGYVNAGAFVAYTQPQKNQRSVRPVPYAEWNNTNMRWEYNSNNTRDNTIATDDATNEMMRLLAETDWTQLADTPDYIKDSYAPYRVALREIALQSGYPFTIVWPDLPTFELYRVPDAGAINESGSVTVVLSTTQIVDNTLVPFTIYGANITVGDISTLRMNGDVIPTALSGDLEVIGGQATLQVTFANDLSTEGVEEMIVYLPGTLPMIKVNVNINDTSYA
jgi:hypothetical protein